MLRTCLSNDIIVHDFSFNYFCKHCIHCICYCSKFCTLTLNLYIFERRNKINQTNKQILNYSVYTFEDRIYLETYMGMKTREYTFDYGLSAVAD